MTWVHSENSRFVASTTAALSARLGDHLKQELGDDLGQRNVSDLVDGDEIVRATRMISAASHQVIFFAIAFNSTS